MGNIGNFGDISFYCKTVKKKPKVLSFHDMTRSASASYSEHERNGGKAYLEFNSDGLDELTLTIEVNAALGVKPATVEKKLFDQKNKGTAEYFVLGGKKIGKNPYVITAIEEGYNSFYTDGRLISASFQITLKEYANKTAKTKKSAATTKSAGTAKKTIVSDGKVSEPAVKSTTSYTVKVGDSLWKIAESFYGKGALWTKIYNANKDIIKKPDLIYEGQVFTIPA
jgi:LysM repeat protein